MLSVSAHDLDAVTVDALGTLVELADPAGHLREALLAYAVARDERTVREAFRTEVRYYVAHTHEGRDEATLTALRETCAGVFLEAAGVELDPTEFAEAFVGAFEFHPVAGAEGALAALRGAGLALACVTNWDVGFHEYLARAGLAEKFDVVVTSGEAGVPKPDPRIFELALSRLGVQPARALHVGDSHADRAGAEAAGMAFAPAPLATLPARLGLR